jgi:hypothetical protein
MKSFNESLALSKWLFPAGDCWFRNFSVSRIGVPYVSMFLKIAHHDDAQSTITDDGSDVIGLSGCLMQLQRERERPPASGDVAVVEGLHSTVRDAAKDVSEAVGRSTAA